MNSQVWSVVAGTLFLFTVPVLAQDAEPVEVEATPVPAEPVPAEPVPAEPVPAEPVPAESTSLPYDVGVFAGTLRPAGELKNYVDAGTTFNVAVGKLVCDRSEGSMRAAISVSNTTELEASRPNQSGSLEIMAVKAQVDYAFKTPVVRPVVGLGLGLYKWSLDVAEYSQSNKKDGSDPGFHLMIGADYRPIERLVVAPEVSYQWVRGDFNQTLLSAGLALRWIL